jgi:hypothetical protein
LKYSGLEFNKIIKDLKDEKWIEIKEKNRKQKTSPTISVKSNISIKSDGVFTKLCSFIINNQECPNKDKCTFAHNSDDLILKECRFDDICRNVKNNNGIYINTNKEYLCVYIHSCESKQNYLKRVYNIKPETEIKKETKKIEIISKKILDNNEIAPLLKWCKKPVIVSDEIVPIEKYKENNWIEVENIKNNRTKAFEILSDKEKIKTQLKFTKMCYSIINNTQCPHKEKCRFAHNIKDLIIRDCLFQDKCFNVKKELKNGQYHFINISKTKICDCIHKDETTENYYIRIGITSKNDLVKQKTSPIIKKIEISNKNPLSVENINNQKDLQKENTDLEIKPILKLEPKPIENAWFKNKPNIKKDVEDFIHIKVPKNMEKVVIQMGIKSGKALKVETY